MHVQWRKYWCEVYCICLGLVRDMGRGVICLIAFTFAILSSDFGLINCYTLLCVHLLPTGWIFIHHVKCLFCGLRYICCIASVTPCSVLAPGLSRLTSLVMSQLSSWSRIAYCDAPRYELVIDDNHSNTILTFWNKPHIWALDTSVTASLPRIRKFIHS